VSAALRVAALSKRYGALQALDEVSFEAAPGELIAVLGPNGAGKTTLLSIIAGVQRASSGTVSRAPREVGWVPQQSALYAKLSVAENLELFARLAGVADPPGAVAAMLIQTGLAERAGDPVGRLSGGNRQRVNVAIGLIADPPVLALDEPSAALDAAQRRRLWEFLDLRRAAGTAVVFSGHDGAEAQRHADRLLILADGRLVFDGTPAGLLERQPRAGGDLETAMLELLATLGEGDGGGEGDGDREGHSAGGGAP
jgi:ABC-2 type transport system ATP-binding protein